ncbi:HDOD domain-containing protein [Desulfosoma caldarium]|uniref:Putative nucleotidyltransferase with HDIG domain n=1 Tax=Desulfosoma caldarium TaxID=610254 RepID=A0A3N1UTA4_9BACT|nr:HDOD domain-containing protein [Desulfosoma caldarium]ROQ93373.1 putative nucleotidyltransferase with HDIG domain [Desulfosoma caldarium]
MKSPSPLPDDHLHALVQVSGDLPAMPHVASEALQKMSNPDVRVEDLQRILAKDPALAARVLKLANSSFYARSRTIATLRDAVVVVGLKTVRALILASVTRDLFDPFGLTEKLLWEHAVGCALAARTLAVTLRFSKQEECFLAGLLHDVGKMILLTHRSEPMRRIIEEVYNNPSLSFVDEERETFGFDHSQVGHLLAAKWRFPEEIIEAIACHHRPASAKIVPALTVIVHLANAYCHKLALGPTKRPDLDLSTVVSARALRLKPEKLAAIEASIRSVVETEASCYS